MINFHLFGLKKDFFDFNARSVIKLILNIINKKQNLSNDDHVVSFILVNKETIQNINRDYRNIDRVTDVISFAEIDDETNVNRILPFELGTIYLCVDKVYEQANEYGHSIKREFSFLVTHGMLHLLGYDHMKKEDEIKMFALQDVILDEAKIFR